MSKGQRGCDCAGCYQFRFGANGKYLNRFRTKRQNVRRVFPRMREGATTEQYIASFYFINDLHFKE